MLPRRLLLLTSRTTSHLLRRTTPHRTFASGPNQAEEFNEPGGRLWGEKILAPGEKRKWQVWEAPAYTTFGLAALMLIIGLNYRPNTYAHEWARKEAVKRMEEMDREEAAAEAAANEQQQV